MKAARGGVLAADLGGTKIAVARVSPSGRLSGYATAPTPVGAAAVVARLAAMLAALQARGGAERAAVAVPGLAYANGDVWAPNLPGWRRMPLGRRLQRRLLLPVRVESDRNAFIAGEVWRGAARGATDAILVAVGTGIGAGIWSGGRLLRGHAELAGAIGWMALRPEYRPAYRGCGGLEFHAAGPGLARAATAQFGAPLAATDLARRARAGDLAARRLLRQAGEELGRALANLVSILNPEIIVLSGGVATAGPWLFAPARRELRRWAQPLAARQVRLVRSRLGPHAALLGVARLAQTPGPEAGGTAPGKRSL
ncbi:MAG: ROK family protein [Terriglobales bacterium]